MKTVSVLGCTGSVGGTSLKVIKDNPDKFKLGLVANNSDLCGLKKIIAEFKPAVAVCVKEKYLYANGGEYSLPENFLSDFDNYSYSDVVVNGIAGVGGLSPSLTVLKAGKTLATANKESIICGGALMYDYAKKFGGEIFPVDSEHSAIWQLIDGKIGVKKIYITASGGAFRDLRRDELAGAKAADALKHPNWKMGRKITVDCATLMNKGMEIIEAKRLFGHTPEPLIERKSLVHALAEFVDGSVAASLSFPDMARPVLYALTYPEICLSRAKSLNLHEMGELSFSLPDRKRFPCLKIAENVSKHGDIAACVMCSADEILVGRYIRGEIKFYDISDGIEKSLDKFAQNGDFMAEEDIFCMDRVVGEYALSMTFGG